MRLRGLACVLTLLGCSGVPLELDPHYERSEDCVADGSCTSPREPLDCNVDPYELVAVCGENEALCAACGCYACDPYQDVGPFCDWRVGAAPGLLSCTPEGCLAKTPCADGDTCVVGYSTGLAVCENDLDCDVVGCTKPSACDAAIECGPCGCCSASDMGEPAAFCDYDSSGWSAWELTVQGCYSVERCASGDTCLLDDYGRPGCYAPSNQ